MKIKVEVINMEDPLLGTKFKLVGQMIFEEGVPYVFTALSGRTGFKKVTIIDYIKYLIMK